MTWYPHYRIEWTDNLGVDWKIDIEETIAPASILPMQATEKALNFDFLTGSDNILEYPVKGSTAEFTAYSETNFQWLNIYSTFDLEKRVSIYMISELFWVGFITPGQYSEPYDGDAYPVSFTASDGLGFLKNLAYKDDTIAYSGRKLTSQILFDILNKIQVESFNEFVNIYETTMDSSVGDSPFDQEEIDADVFLDMSCYEVLEHILKKYNAIIRQCKNTITIYRPTELVNASLVGRNFTGPTTKTSIDIAPSLFISRTGAETDINDFEGGTLSIQPAVAKININQDYQNKESWIDNWNFIGNTFHIIDTTNYSIDFWTAADDCKTIPINTAMPSETDGVLISSHNTYPATTKYISQSFGAYSIVTDELLYIEFSYLLYNFSTTDRAGEVIYVEISNDTYSHYLYADSDNTALWQSSPASFAITADAPVGTQGWATFKRQISGLPVGGSYTIKLFAINDTYTDVYVGFKDVKFYATSDHIVIYSHNAPKRFGYIFLWGKRPMIIDRVSVVTEYVTIHKTYTHDNGVKGQIVDYDSILGDVIDPNIENIIEQFKGSLANDSMKPTSIWSTRGGSELQPLLQLICDELAFQYSRAKQLIRLPVWESAKVDSDLHIDMLGYYQDSLNQISGANRGFVINGASFKTRDREWTLDLVEVIPPAAPYVPPVYSGYGALYNFFAVGTDLLAPEGCHIPTDAEFQIMIDYLDSEGDYFTNLAGGYLKELGFDHWDTPNTGADNSTGFTALGSGQRDPTTGVFAGRKVFSNYWTTSPFFDDICGFELTYASASLQKVGLTELCGESVRCLLDEPESWTEGMTITDIDGHVYSTIQIGTQVWLGADLNVTKLNDGTPIPNIINNTLWTETEDPAMCYYGNIAPEFYLTSYLMIWLYPDPLTYLASSIYYNGGGVFTVSYPGWVDIAVYNEGSEVAEGDGWYSGYELQVTPNIDYHRDRSGVVVITQNGVSKNITVSLVVTI